VKKIIALRLIAVTLLVALSGVPSAAVADEDAKIVQLMKAENGQHIGEKLPASLQVEDRAGARIILASALKGPSWIVVINPNCRPCQELIDYLRAHQGRSPQGYPVAILSFERDRALLRQVPHEIPFYVSVAPRKDSFFSGTMTPALFFFDKNHNLLGRQSGLVGTPESTLSVPEAIVKSLQ
jgi:hypothetical protein